MTDNNPKLDVNVDAHENIGQILSLCSQGIERKQNSDIILRKMPGNNPKLDLVNVVVHIKYGKILSIRSQDFERKRNSHINQGL